MRKMTTVVVGLCFALIATYHYSAAHAESLQDTLSATAKIEQYKDLFGNQISEDTAIYELHLVEEIADALDVKKGCVPCLVNVNKTNSTPSLADLTVPLEPKTTFRKFVKVIKNSHFGGNIVIRSDKSKHAQIERQIAAYLGRKTGVNIVSVDFNDGQETVTWQPAHATTDKISS